MQSLLREKAVPSVRWHVQCDVPCDDDPGAGDGGASGVPRTCVDTVVPANTVHRVARALKPAVRTLVLLHDGCAAADRFAEELLAGAGSLTTIVRPVRDLQQLSSTLLRYQNDTGVLVLLPSYRCLEDQASPSAVRARGPSTCIKLHGVHTRRDLQVLRVWLASASWGFGSCALSLQSSPPPRRRACQKHPSRFKDLLSRAGNAGSRG